VPSFILIHPTVWPQCTNVTDGQDRQTGQRSDSIERTVLQTVAQKQKSKKTVSIKRLEKVRILVLRYIFAVVCAFRVSVMDHIYTVFRKKRGSTFVIITLDNLDGF